MDPSLVEILKQAASGARRQGLGWRDQYEAAEAALLSMVPNLSPSIATLIVQQLYPLVSDRPTAA